MPPLTAPPTVAFGRQDATCRRHGRTIIPATDAAARAGASRGPAGAGRHNRRDRRCQLHHNGTRRLLAAGLPLAAIITALWSGRSWSPPLRLGAAILLPYAALKAAAVLRQPPGTLRRAGIVGSLAYLTVWPGMLLAPFTAGRAVPLEARVQARRDLRQGLRNLTVSGAAILLLAWWAPRLTDDELGIFVVAHALLDCLFAALALIYLGLAAWHLWLR